MLEQLEQVAKSHCVPCHIAGSHLVIALRYTCNRKVYHQIVLVSSLRELLRSLGY